MAKHCINCGTELNDSTLFCPCCGSEQVSPVNFDNEKTFYAQNNLKPVTPKKNNSALIVAVCATALCVITVATVAILFATGTLSFNKNKDDGQKGDSSVSEAVGDDLDTSPPDNPKDTHIPYTKGEVRNGEYINEWAGFKFRIPSNYPEAHSSIYQSYNATLSSGECGYISTNGTSGNILGISYEDNPENKTAEEILNTTIKISTEELKYTNPIEFGKFKSIYIGGEEYTSSTMYYTNTETYGMTAVRIFDNKVITIVITGSDLNECMNVLNSFEEA